MMTTLENLKPTQVENSNISTFSNFSENVLEYQNLQIFQNFQIINFNCS